MQQFEIIDFHTHPFLRPENNICSHAEYAHMSPENTLDLMRRLGVSRICGSVIAGVRGEDPWERVLHNNDQALKLRDLYGDFYIPGFHVNPDFPDESCREIQRMAQEGLILIGEIVPYYDHWQATYDSPNFDVILDAAEEYGMVVSFHPMDEDDMDRMVERHPGITFVAAHPGEYKEFMRHMERMKKSDRYYLDLSGYGIFRHGMLRHGIDLFGPERFLYGSDFPTCNPAMYLGGVLLDDLISDDEKRMILSENAKRILNIR